DNGSQDGTGAWLRSAAPDVAVVSLERNLGFAEGCNRGIAAAGDVDWIATLNDDARPDPGWIGALRAAAAAAAPSVGMLQAEVLRGADREVVASRGVEICRDGVLRDLGAGQPATPLTGSREIFGVSAAAALYRRAMLDGLRIRSGVFDRGCFAYFEDVDLGWRARLAGWQAQLVPGARVLHAEHASAVRMPAGFLARQTRRNRVRVLLKNASPRFLLRAAPRLARDVAAAALADPREVGAWLAAALDGARQRRDVSRLVRVPRREVERRWIDTAAAGP
ncbi:MAG TPA: glycosyltransferase family 2 protein, partial [Myxococcota bacterium]|nr:glycosyltransferase family 2 protein [Myxococcota bacterium]